MKIRQTKRPNIICEILKRFIYSRIRHFTTTDYKILQKQFRARPAIAPNLGFWRQMIEWEGEHNDGKTTVKLVKMEGMKRLVPDVYQVACLSS